ncbi:MAG: hypothetical protein V7746_20490 [Halioglobus sp.]
MTALEMQEKIQKFLETEFERELFTASIGYLENDRDPLRFNSFAYSLRELIRNIFSRKAPDDVVKSCTWYKNETENDKPSRRQRYLYCVQGGLTNEFVHTELALDVLEPWKEIKGAIDALSKFTHVSKGTFNLAEADYSPLVYEALSKLLVIFDMVDSTRFEIYRALESHIDRVIVDTLLSNTFSEIDLLSNNSFVEYSEVIDLELADIDSKIISFSGTGLVQISQNYSKHDDHVELVEDYPFQFKGHSPVEEPYRISISPQDVEIDTSSWYGEE